MYQHEAEERACGIEQELRERERVRIETREKSETDTSKLVKT